MSTSAVAPDSSLEVAALHLVPQTMLEQTPVDPPQALTPEVLFLAGLGIVPPGETISEQVTWLRQTAEKAGQEGVLDVALGYIGTRHATGNRSVTGDMLIQQLRAAYWEYGLRDLAALGGRREYPRQGAVTVLLATASEAKRQSLIKQAVENELAMRRQELAEQQSLAADKRQLSSQASELRKARRCILSAALSFPPECYNQKQGLDGNEKEQNETPVVQDDEGSAALSAEDEADMTENVPDTAQGDYFK